MKKGDCFIHSRLIKGQDEEIVISRFDRIMGLCFTTDISIRAEEITSEYIDVSRHKYTMREIECFRHFPSVKFQCVLNSIHSLYKESNKLLSSSMSPVENHQTQENDCYCKSGRIEYVIGAVNMFRPSWNVDTIWFDKLGYAAGHYRFGVDADKYNKAPEQWKLTDEVIYDRIKKCYESYIKELRSEIIAWGLGKSK